ncbi:HAD family hydrolase [Companilactobacillus futsaii]|uniref:Cof-type HAD-IIB family hydrolase n=2 Tax=Companilactobacillus futsaii TaxID=938155 RepID=A0A5B7T2P6_9LACO|nr:HAD family hydrolase [Companilactobacillus futsaii]KRK90566.1 HAD superfamily hydrolase [Companilactobacillus futsaii JCM 17355]QCX24632.1 Cof-type HAD-IIB family hydrolase [Companilactobacillus futsaii]
MPEYLVFMDLDGTLLTSDHKHISPRTKQTIEDLQQRGVVFYIATGRMYELAKITQRLLNPNVKMITSNGAVFDGAKGREIIKLGSESVKLAYRITSKYQLPMMLFTPEKAYFTRKIPDFIAQNAGNFDEDFGYEEVESFSELESVTKDITNGVILSRGDMSELNIVRDELVDSQLMEMSSSSPDNLEMIPLRTDKGTAVKRIQQEWGIDYDHTFVFGDGMNDVGMMKEAKYSVAMGNGLPEVKKVANFVTETNAKDGLAKFLEDYFVKEK